MNASPSPMNESVQPGTTPCRARGLRRRQVLALLASLGIEEGALAQDARSADPRSFRVLLDNDQLRVLEYTSRPGLAVCGQGMHTHPDHLTIAMASGKVRATLPDGKQLLRDVPQGLVFYSPAETHAVENIGGANYRAYIIELKGPGYKPSTG